MFIQFREYQFQIFLCHPCTLFFCMLLRFFLQILKFFMGYQFIQILFALISIYFTHRILLEFFSEKLSLIGTLIFTIFPLNIYAVSQISSISMQILLINVFLFSLLRLFEKLDYKYIFMFSISSGFLMLLRGEFFIFVILSTIYLYLNKKINKNDYNCFNYNFSCLSLPL